MASASFATPPIRDVADFLDWVERQPERWEFVDRRLIMMAGASTRHNDIQVNLISALRARLRSGPCRVNGPDLLLKVSERTGRFPDASVTCGARAGNHFTEPVALFEILSPSSEREDRGPKRHEYQGLASVRHYVLIAQDIERVEIYSRREGGWFYVEIEGQEASADLEGLGITLPLAELYDGVEALPPEPGAT